MRALNRIERGAHKRLCSVSLCSPLSLSAGLGQGNCRVSGGFDQHAYAGDDHTLCFCRQQKRKVSGKRGDFGACRCGRASRLCSRRADNTTREVEKALDRLTREAGFEWR